ncbi:hypothetical protein EXS54_03095 [Patescibacteria group bacterium]|nr:hypothetical protein [Patescibacteria group bacterium]
MSTFALIIALLTVTAGILVKLIGLPDQIRKNHQRQSTEGLSTAFILMTMVSYTLWTAHGLLENDWVVVIGQGFGIFVTAIIVYQIFKYRGRKAK